jgi:hypothetical protein
MNARQAPDFPKNASDNKGHSGTSSISSQALR